MLSGRLVHLRALEMGDLERCLGWINDPEVTRYLGSAARYPISRADEEAWLSQAVHKTRPPEIVLAIDTLDEERHIGTIALSAIDGADRKASLGIMIGEKDCWSRGFGTDAILTLLRFAFGELNLNRVWLEVHEDNQRGIACYRKCGFIEEGRLRQDRYRAGQYVDTLVMGVLAAELRANPQAGEPGASVAGLGAPTPRPGPLPGAEGAPGGAKAGP